MGSLDMLAIMVLILLTNFDAILFLSIITYRNKKTRVDLENLKLVGHFNFLHSF